MKLQKRKSVHEGSEPSAKRARNQMKTVIREKATPKSKASKSSTKKPKKAKKKKLEDSGSPIPAGERRRSGRAHAISSYTERADADDDEDMLDGVAEWEYENENDSGPEGGSEEEEGNSGSEEEGSGAEDEAGGDEEEEAPPPQSTKKAAANGQAKSGRSTRGRGKKTDDSDAEEEDD